MNLASQELSISRLTGSRIVVVCQEAYAQALSTGVPAERLSLIPNGVNIEQYTPGRSGAEFRKHLGIPADALLVGFLGRLAWEKGPDKFVQMAGRINQQRPDVHFAVVGEGSLEQDLVNMIARMGLGSRVHMAGLWRNPWEVYPAFDVFAQTSRSEAMPLAILEAMACGLPVVAIAVGGVAELVEAGTSGLLVSPGDWPGVASPFPGDWEGAASALLELIQHREKMKSMGAAGRKRVEQMFDLRRASGLTAELFERMARAGSALEEGWQTAWPALNGFSDTPLIDPHPTSVG